MVGMQSLLVEAEKQQWLQREATLEEAIKQLRSENDLRIKKEASLEETIKVLQNENDMHINKEATLEETIQKLQSENHSHIQKEAGLEMKIIQLQNEKDSLLEKVAMLEEKIGQLLGEKATLGLKGASLEEKVKHLERETDFRILNENSNKDTIANLNSEITTLRAQVLEWEESRSNLLQENQKLVENISSLQSQLQSLESTSSAHSLDEFKKLASERENLNSQIGAAQALVEKLITENSELVEKVNELYIVLDRRSTTAGLPSAVGSDQMVESTETTTVADPMSESNENLSVTGQKLESVEIPMKDESIRSNKVDAEDTAVSHNLPVSDVPSEIVQIPLNENEVQDLESQIAENNEKAAVPLTDAPLIGAPFRLISFFANYVSGADLVNKS